MEDVISKDDTLIKYLFEKQKSPNGRFPITLWNRIKHILFLINLSNFKTKKDKIKQNKIKF